VTVNSWNSPYSTNISIAHNHISGKYGDGISIAGFVPFDPGYMRIASNTISGSGQSGINIEYHSYYSVEDVIITSNVISDSTLDGIRINSHDGDYVKNYEIGTNVITNNSGHGVFFHSDGFATTAAGDLKVNILMDSNTICNNSAEGIDIGLHDFFTGGPRSIVNSTIAFNRVSNNSGSGISVNLFKTKANSTFGMTSNTVLGNGGNGIYVDPSDDLNVRIAVTSNTIGNNSGNGVNLYRTRNAYLASNTVSGSTINGVYLDHTISVNLTSNTLSDNAKNGVHVTVSYYVTFYRNEVNGSGRHGFFIESSSWIDIVSNTVKNTQYYAIYLGPPPSSAINTDIRIVSNTITSNDRGIVLNVCKDITISSNYVSRAIFAIQLVDRANNTLIAGNTATDSVYGIHVKSSTGNRIYHNRIENNTGQARDDKGPENTWDDGYPSGGNYWGDYPGSDYFSGPGQDIPGSDGIGDTPYVIDADSGDRYPLISLYGFHAPTVNITSPSAGAWSNSTTVGITGTANDAIGDLSHVEVSCDGGVKWKTANGAASWTYTCNGLLNGSNTIKARAFDLQDSVSIPDETIVNVDAVPPVVRIDSPADGEWFNTATVNVSGTAADAGIGLDRVEVSCNGGLSWSLAAGNQSWACSCSLATGTNFIESRSFDKGGLESSHHRIRVNIDLDAPNVSIMSPFNGTWYEVTTVTVSGTAADSGGVGLDRIEVSCDGNLTWRVATGKTSWTLDCVGLFEGTNVILARAFDLNGHESPSDKVSVEVDLTPPSVDIISPRDGQWFGVTYAVVNGTASDNGGSGPTRVEVSCDDSATWHEVTGISNWAFNCTGLAEGPNVIHSRAFDLVGWESDDIFITINVNLTLPLVVIMSPEDGGWISTGTVTVSGVASSHLNGLQRVEVSCNGGYSWNAATGTGNWLYACINLPEGAISINARAFDTGGYESPHDAIVVNRDSIPPGVELTSPSNWAWFNSTTIRVSGTAWDAGSGVEKVEVSCDDGTSWIAATGTNTWSYDCIAVTEGTNTL